MSASLFSKHEAQRLRYPLIKEYASNYNGNPNKKNMGVSGSLNLHGWLSKIGPHLGSQTIGGRMKTPIISGSLKGSANH